jgi:hypothetical protein
LVNWWVGEWGKGRIDQQAARHASAAPNSPIH